MWDSVQSIFQPATSPPQLYRNLAIALMGSFALFALLHRFLGPRGRRWLIVAVTFGGGLFYGLEYFYPVKGEPKQNFLTPGIEPVGIMISVIGAFTVGLGIYSLCQVHGRNVAQRRAGWHNSLAFFLAMAAMLLFGMWDHYLSKAAAAGGQSEQQGMAPIGQPAVPGGVFVDGELVEAAAVTEIAGHPAVPMRAVVERAGGTVHWRRDAKEASAAFGGHKIAVTIGGTQAEVDGQTRAMPFAATLRGNRTIVPGRFLCEALGLASEYDSGVLYVASSPPPQAPGGRPWPVSTYEVLFNGLFMPLQAATFSLLAFYIASAAYRAFRIRTAEAALMMAAAFIVMMGQVPVGAWLTSGLPTTGTLAFFRLESLGEWVLSWLNTPAQRGIVFGVAIGGLAMSLRIWLSLERGTFFSERS